MILNCEVQKMERDIGERICCFTGHRPPGLPFGEDEQSEMAIRLKTAVERELIAKIEDGCETFITGCAQGADMICGELVIKLKEERYPSVKLICAVPFRGMADHWPTKWQKRYEYLLSAATEVVEICPKNVRGCFHRRNRYMVDHSTEMIAIYNGEKSGGTYYTINYAVKQGRNVVVFDVRSREIYRPE